MLWFRDLQERLAGPIRTIYAESWCGIQAFSSITALMKQTTRNWLRGADYDLQTAQSLWKSHRYIYVIFMCHLAVEKLLKAIITEDSTSLPPRTHNLYRLLELSHIEVLEAHKDIVAKLNTMSVATRYPEDVEALVGEVTRQIARNYLVQTEALLAWLKQDPRLQS